MRNIPFVKMQGCGNDFVLIDGRSFSLDDINLSVLSVSMCDRHFGVGADGIILVLPSEKADFKMRMFNPDGSEAEVCGNGIRCFTRYVYEKSDLPSGEKKEIISVETLGGTKVPAVIVDNGEITGIEVDMGIPDKEGLNETLQVEGQEFKINKISMGNPHCVIFTDNLSKIEIAKIGSIIENLPQFPHRTNVEFAQVLNRGEINLKVWERGAGETLACGTGACAAASAAIYNGLTNKKIIVHLSGGDLEIEIDNDGHCVMRGPAEKVFEGTYFSENV